MPHSPGIAPPDLFGVVGRDPWYEWNTNPKYPGLNLEFLENMARELRFMGARYIRIEFRADEKPGTRGGEVNFAKYDAFVNDIAPRYGLKVLGLLGYAIVNWDSPSDQDLHYRHYNDPPDNPDGTNNLIRMYSNRARDIMAHYGDKVASWEILNEFNYWEGVSLLPERAGTLMVQTYTLGKQVSPHSQIIVGAQLAMEPPNGPISETQYFNAFYGSAPVQEYYKHTHAAPLDNTRFPWDGVAWHPYFTNVYDSVKSVQQVIGSMRGWGDTTSKLWITEVGLQAHTYPLNQCLQDPQEVDQANFLSDFFKQLTASNLNDIATIFWFKYEDFYDSNNGNIIPYGLVRLQPNGGNQASYAPSGIVARYKTAYYTFQKLAGPDLPVDSVPTQPNTAGQTYFKETGHTLSGVFLNYWQSHGGLEVFGFPLTEPFEELNLADGKRYTVQYFQRERFEYHPENKGTPYEVLLGLLGTDLLREDCRGYGPLPPPTGPAQPFRTYFAETGHYLSFAFKSYWEKHGGLSLFGYPISEEMVETSPVDSKKYTVQYFERARLEYHPDAPAGYQVQLALLGTELLKRRTWVR